MLQSPLVQLVFLVLAVWMVLQLLVNALGPVSLLPVVALSGFLVVTVYLLCHDRARISKVYRYPGCKQGIDLVCRLIRQQPPVDLKDPATAVEMLLLREPQDFEWAKHTLKKRILGHDAAIDATTERLKQNVLLRQRRGKRSSGPPLGVFLFVGCDGIGKRSLAALFGQLLYRAGTTTLLRLDDYPGDQVAIPALFGGTGQEGALMGPVKRQPYHTIILENVESAGPKLIERLQGIHSRGTCTDPANGSIVSFQHCLFVLTTSRVPLGLDGDEQSRPSGGLRQQTILDAVATETGLSHPFLGLMHEIVLFPSPDNVTKARVILLMIEQECRKYHLHLDHVEPEIVAEEVAAYSDTYGFQLSEARIHKWLRDPIVKASQHKLDHLVLTREMLITPVLERAHR